ncbi:hypothetical protein LSCM1_05830 [Leishmania martiniquensis]|uniref:Uncharacterized protein n=1 Tax=Leishmania martiniquensis TaxID=1580590 RepID=A0A836KV58_9TRYP|nr:hypothetical protein LSCM1_05830 [Leishmania martiniquensis]
MSLSQATALYADATRLYRLGDLHHARDAAEEALLSLSPCTDSRIKSSSHRHGGDISHEEPADTASVSVEGSQAQRRQRHRLFGNILILLSSIYMAVQDFTEAERLLVTCDGYWREHLTDAHAKRASASTFEEATRSCCSELDEGLAGVAYNRAVLRLEQLQSAPSSLTCFGDRSPLVAPLVDVCGADARLTNLSLSSSATAAPSATLEPVLASVMALLLAAQDRLAHTLGPPRRLLADVLHTVGVCHYEAADYIAALQAWQRSMAIRAHLHSLRQRSETCAAQHTLSRGEGVGESGDGTEELKLALTMEHVAQVYRLLEGRSIEALKLLDTVADTRRKYLGPTDPLYARTLVFKGVLAVELGHKKLARVLFERCSAILSDASLERRPARSSSCALQEVEQWRLHLGSTSPSSCSPHPLTSKQWQERAPGGCVGVGSQR